MTDSFFQYFRGELRNRAHQSHPSFSALLSYAEGEIAEDPEGVSAHVVTCAPCQRELAEIRAELGLIERAMPKLLELPTRRKSLGDRWRDLRHVVAGQLWKRPAVYGHTLAYATAALLLIALNFNQLRPSGEPGYQGGGGIWWVQWPLLIWGAVLLWHGYRAWRRGR
jgi:hypothetical protein